MHRLVKFSISVLLTLVAFGSVTLILTTTGHLSAGAPCLSDPKTTAVCNGDVNGDGGRDVSDASYLLNFLFLGGPPPAAFAGGPGGGTLDDAYDAGGPGLGGIIMADAGPVEIRGEDGLRVAMSSQDPEPRDFALFTVEGTGDFLGNHIAAFRSRGSDADGIAITLGDGGDANADNNFVTFFNGDGNVAGRIEGYDFQNNDWIDPPPLGLFDLRLSDFSFDTGIDFDAGAFPNIQLPQVELPRVTLPQVTLPSATLPSLAFSRGTLPSASFSRGRAPSLSIDFGFPPGFDFDPGALPSLTFRAGSLPSATFNRGSFTPGSVMGGSVTPGSVAGGSISGGRLPNIRFGAPSVSAPTGLASDIEQLVCWALDSGLDGLLTTNPFDLALAAVLLAQTERCKDGGVTYGSHGADYAEWLPKLDPEEKMIFGQIVGVHDGKITKKTDGADQIMSVSLAPVVVGNLPRKGEEHLFAKVSFMGQVPVMVRGRVRNGDYIVPSGKNDGTGIGVAPEELDLEQMTQVLGRAWEDSERDDLSVVNVLIGVKVNETSEIVKRHARRLNDLEARVAELEARVVDLENGNAQLSGLAARIARLEQSTLAAPAHSDAR